MRRLEADVAVHGGRTELPSGRVTARDTIRKALSQDRARTTGVKWERAIRDASSKKTRKRGVQKRSSTNPRVTHPSTGGGGLRKERRANPRVPHSGLVAGRGTKGERRQKPRGPDSHSGRAPLLGAACRNVERVPQTRAHTHTRLYMNAGGGRRGVVAPGRSEGLPNRSGSRHTERRSRTRTHTRLSRGGWERCGKPRATLGLHTPANSGEGHQRGASWEPRWSRGHSRGAPLPGAALYNVEPHPQARAHTHTRYV